MAGIFEYWGTVDPRKGRDGTCFSVGVLTEEDTAASLLAAAVADATELFQQFWGLNARFDCALAAFQRECERIVIYMIVGDKSEMKLMDGKDEHAEVVVRITPKD
jgi:hypothetical protein